MSPAPAGERSRIVDALRGLSIAAVVAYHFHKLWFPSGNYGVLLFFLLSGYCIAESAETARGAWHFWSKRLARLLPALLVCGAVTVAVKQWLPVPADRQVDWGDFLNTMLVLPTLNPLRVEYRLPDGAYWSLIVEFQFYALVAVLMLAGLQRRLLAGLALALAAVQAVAVLLPAAPMLPALACHLPAFVAGAAAHAIHRGQRRAGWLALLVAVGAYAFAPAAGLTDPGLTAAGGVARLAFAAGLLLLLSAPWLEQRIGGSPAVHALAALGLVSYPLYLLHQDLGWLLLASLSLQDDYGSAVSVSCRLVLLPAVFALLAWMVWRWVERPLRPYCARLLSGLPARIDRILMAGADAVPGLRRWPPVLVRAGSLLLCAAAMLGAGRLLARPEIARSSAGVAALLALAAVPDPAAAGGVGLQVRDSGRERIVDVIGVSYGACAGLLARLQTLAGVRRIAVGTRAADETGVPLAPMQREQACLGVGQRIVRVIAVRPETFEARLP